MIHGQFGHTVVRLVSASLTFGAIVASAVAADPEPKQRAAERLIAATVTVRMTVPAAAPQPSEVVVSSGVSLGKGRLVTFVGDRDAATARFRATLPTGDQAESKLRVWDHYSGLVLLNDGVADSKGIELAAEPPNVGATVLTAAAAGIEQPAVSAGILGGADRTLPMVDLPPLLQCDVRTTETSSGAAIVDRDGRLVGIVAATAAAGERPGWTYAVPVSHVTRLLAAEKDQQVIELKRRRPALGLTLGTGEKDGTVQVERVENGPAAKAGIQKGDIIVEADGRRIRSAYQAVNRIMAKQPGDKVTLVIDRQGQRQQMEVTLDAAGAAPPPAAFADTREVKVGPQLRITGNGNNSITVRNSQGVEEVAIEPPARARRTPTDEVEMLRIQVSGFEKVIQKLETEIAAREQSQSETAKLVESLKAEIAQLKGARDGQQGARDEGRGTRTDGQAPQAAPK
ncbi:MAG TPA: S1C family serine protease [Pirellulales bacterium]|nr:S1C family serine protease [Pirellulales bacterium]